MTKPVSEMTPHDKLCAALSIIQHHTMAVEAMTELRGSEYKDPVFGNFFFPTTSLELAASLLTDCLGPLEDVK